MMLTLPTKPPAHLALYGQNVRKGCERSSSPRAWFAGVVVWGFAVAKVAELVQDTRGTSPEQCAHVCGSTCHD